MAITKHGVPTHRYLGLSTDTKPTKATHDTPAGSTFYEYDTGIMYITYDGTNWVVKGEQPIASIATATTGAIAKAVNPGAKFRLLRMEWNVDTAGTTSESLTITVDAGDGAAYDTIIYSRNTSVGSPTDLVVVFGEGYEFEADDHLDIAWPNTENRTYGLRILYELI